MRLIGYASTCTAPAKKFDAIVSDICATAKIENAKLDVTGVLICETGHFVQLLEGENAVLGKLFASIKDDPRHTNIITLVDETIEERSFGDWSMNSFYISDPSLARPETIQALHDVHQQHFKTNAAQLSKFFQHMVDSLDKFQILST